jgi:hypothetical protein
MTSEMDGRIAPASIAAVVPQTSKTLSLPLRYEKYFVKAI